jgi:hypothetical protein
MAARDKFKYSVIQYKINPFLSIITRRLEGKRDQLFEQHLHSLKNIGSDFEQIFIKDYTGQGMLSANASFQYVQDLIQGEFVFLLDDDDFITDDCFIEVLKENAKDTDVIFFKNKIHTGDGDEVYPKPESWESRTPKRSQIGGSCFVIRKWIYDKYIHHFAHPVCGDWHFITEVLKEETIKTKWVNRMMFETGKVSHGGW